MADTPELGDMDVKLNWPGGPVDDGADRSAAPALPASPGAPGAGAEPAPNAPRRGVRLRVGERSGALQAEVAGLRADVDALRDEVDSLRRELGERRSVG